MALARRMLRPLSFVLLEVVGVDRACDPAPSDVAELLVDRLRTSDTISRDYDGAFALVLESTSEHGAIWAVERLRRDLVVRLPDAVLHAGISTYPIAALGSGDVFAKAMTALAAAQGWPGHRIEVAPPSFVET